MTLRNTYQTRPVRFLGLRQLYGWQIKLYSISARAEYVRPELVDEALRQLPVWLENHRNYPLELYRLGTLILHEGRDGNFAILNWWIDENMLQNHVYFSPEEAPYQFSLLSDKGMMSCVWELAVLWFERNAWVEHVLQHPEQPRLEAYLAAGLNGDI